MVMILSKFKNVDIMQALNVLGMTNRKQLKEVDSVLRFELNKCEDLKGKKAIQKTLDILWLVGLLADK